MSWGYKWNTVKIVNMYTKKKHILELCDNDTFMDTTTLMPMTESFQTCQNCLPHGVIDNMVP